MLHGVAHLAWDALAIDLATTTADIQIFGNGQVHTVGSDLSPISSVNWNTLTVSDGVYDLRIVLRDGLSRVVGEAPRIVLVNNSVVWHSGRLSSDETWGPDHVHGVDGDVIVPSGLTLMILPGTVVKFADGTRIIVESGGTLNAVSGDPGAPIIFTSLNDDTAGGDTNLDGTNTRPHPGAWNGLVSQEGGVINLQGEVVVRYVENLRGGTLSSNMQGKSFHQARLALGRAPRSRQTLWCRQGRKGSTSGRSRRIVWPRSLKGSI